jgi:putative ABC transport system substrate-binding protein
MTAELQLLGWMEGKNLSVEARSANARLDRLRAFALDLVSLPVDVIVTYGTEATLAAKTATTKIPIIFASVGDPVGTGLVASLARPGSNITGYSLINSEITQKLAALLHEMLPTVQRVCVLINPLGQVSARYRDAAESAYRSVGLRPFFIEVATEAQFLDSLTEATRRGAEALEFATLSLAISDSAMEALRRSHLPSMVTERDDVEGGGLMSFAPDHGERRKRVATLIDRVLRGAKPADLPVEQPTKFELAVNLTAARELGVRVPASILARADYLIQ